MASEKSVKSYCCRCGDAEDACRNGHTICLKKYMQKKNFNPNGLYGHSCSGEIIGGWGSTKLVMEDFFVSRTLLHIACQKGNGDCVNMLLNDERVDPNILNGDNETPLQMMCTRTFKKFNKDRIIKLLLRCPRVTNIFLYDKYRYSYSYKENLLFSYIEDWIRCISRENSICNIKIIKLFLERDDVKLKDSNDWRDTTLRYNPSKAYNAFEAICYNALIISNFREVIRTLLESGKIPHSSIEKIKSRKGVAYQKVLKVIDEWEEESLVIIKEPDII
jgi:hypothetical protein